MDRRILPGRKKRWLTRLAIGICGCLMFACAGIDSRPYLFSSEDGQAPPAPAKAEPLRKKSAISPEKPEAAYKKAMEAYRNGAYDDAASLFQSVFKNYPDFRLADNALYWTGECLYSKKEYSAAINVFKSVIEKYPDGNKVPDSLLKIGYSYRAMDDYENALYYLTEITKSYPDSSLAEKARNMMDRFQIEEQGLGIQE